MSESEQPPEQDATSPSPDGIPSSSGVPGPGGSSGTLIRSRQGRILGGVAVGLARRFQVEPVVVRVGFIVASLLWGFGIIVYLALWILLPLEGELTHPRRVRHLLILFAAAALILVVVPHPAFYHAPRVITFVILITLVVALLDEMRRPHGVFGTLARVAGAVVGLGVGLAILGLIVVLVAGPLAGVPLSGGVGQRVVHPARVVSGSTYRLLAGSLELDLRGSNVSTFTSVTASVDVGQLRVLAPQKVRVVLDARTGIGRVWRQPGLNMSVTRSSPTLVLHVGVGVGQVSVQH